MVNKFSFTEPKAYCFISKSPPLGAILYLLNTVIFLHTIFKRQLLYNLPDCSQVSKLVQLIEEKEVTNGIY
jgi:flagellar biosynthesis protein FliR